MGFMIYFIWRGELMFGIVVFMMFYCGVVFVLMILKSWKKLFFSGVYVYFEILFFFEFCMLISF